MRFCFRFHYFPVPFRRLRQLFWALLLSAGTVYFMAKTAGGGMIRPVPLILSGTAVNAVMSAVTSFVIFLAKSPESIAAVYNWQMGSIAAAQWKNLALPAAGVLSGTVIFTVCSRYFDMMMMGDEDAAALGLSVKHFRSLMFGFCSIVVASLVSVTGIIRFCGTRGTSYGPYSFRNQHEPGDYTFKCSGRRDLSDLGRCSGQKSFWRC